MKHKDFTYGELLRESFNLTKKHFWFLLGLLAINIVVSGVTDTIPLVGQIVSLLLSVATLHILLIIANGNRPSYRDMLSPIENYQTLWHYFLAILAMFILYGLGASFVYMNYAFSIMIGNSVIPALMAVAAVAGIIYVSVRLGFFGYFILEDRNIGPVEAFKKSWDMTDNRMWKLAAFLGIAFLLNLIGVILLMIGLLFTVPMTMVATALIYKKWKHETVDPFAQGPLSS